MLDLKKIREEPAAVAAGLNRRGGGIGLEDVIETDARRRDLIGRIEAMRAERNKLSQEVGRLMRAGEKAEAESVKQQSSALGTNLSDLEEQLRPVEEELRGFLLALPNLPDQSVPDGADESDNEVVRVCGDPPEFSFDPRPHWDIGEDLGIIDFERAAKIAGARFALYEAAGAKLERALINFMLDVHGKDNGYTEVLPPVLVNEASMTGTGQLPKFADDLFKCEQDELWLIPTAEVPVTNIFRDDILEKDKLPVKYTAYTACFRREAGAHGRETRGLIRQHQFNKVELVKFVEPESSYAELESLTADAEGILKRLGLHYRVVSLCAGDLGFSAAKTYDLEVWLPSYKGFKEISSCSNFEDYQARRANIRYRDDSRKPQYLHTLNGSGLAIGRTVAAVLENYQNEDGTVTVPEALVPYMGIEKIE